MTVPEQVTVINSFTGELKRKIDVLGTAFTNHACYDSDLLALKILMEGLIRDIDGGLK